MKKALIALVAIVSLAACKTSDKKSDRETYLKDSTAAAERSRIMNDTANYTSIKWLDSTFFFVGNVKEGKEVEVSFRFKNTGSHPLVIANVTASCGCTVPEKPEQPIAPGEEAVIKAKFNSNGRKGDNRKHISVDANTKPSRSHELEFEVIVE